MPGPIVPARRKAPDFLGKVSTVLRRSFLAAAALLAMASGVSLAQDIPLDKAMADRVLGKADAPITIIEYASMTCPHCARFHKETLPKIKAAYVDTGKVKLIYRDFPFDGLALRAAAMARCAAPERYFAVVDTIFQQQENWSRAKDPLAALSNIGKLAGMSQAQVDACFKDTKLLDAIAQVRLDGEKTHGVDSTPTFIVGNKKISGAESFESFDKLLKSLPGGA
jgi:protein-disulfide isomerase